ncbi:MAG TPA: choice-of-anchor Q domain-containing protein [Actinomycetales bacterium]|nr:choice-of-anchor Q domain-containing protein [Actinomycetales bacterium]
MSGRARALVSTLAALALVGAPVAMAVPASAATSATIYVATDGADDVSCGTSAAPCRTVTQGVAQALASGADDATVSIAAGTYPENVDTPSWPAGRSLTLLGAGASSTTIDGQSAGVVLRVPGGSVAVEALTLTGGHSSASGGAIDSDGDLTVTSSTLTGNSTTQYGGAIYADHGTVTVTGSTFTDNTASQVGGAISVQGSATLSLTASTLSGNSAAVGGAVSAGTATTTVRSSTLSGNSGYGTVLVEAGMHASIVDSTLYTQASEPLVNGGGATSTVTLTRSVLSDAGPFACNGATFTDGGANVASDDSCGFGDSTGSKVSSADAIGLKPLAANGSSGPRTMAIGPASSAHLVVPAADCAATDERGEPRPGGGPGSAYCDAGAYELQLSALADVYVDGSGTDSSGCGPVADPCRTVQQGVEQARLSTSADVTVHIAKGTYTETVAVGAWPAGRALTLQGAGAASTTIDANGTGTTLSVSAGKVTVRRLRITGADSTGVRSGGDVTLDRVELVDNTSDAGGGAFVGNGRFTIMRSTLAGNTGELAGGGALFVAPGAVATIDRSTLTSNHGPGAAIFNDGGEVTVSSSTLAGDGSEAVVLIGDGTTTIESSILSGSGCAVPVTDGGHNVTSDESCGFSTSGGSVVGSVDEIGLAPLGDFGGPTRTMPPTSFSLAAFPPSNRVPAGAAGCPASGSPGTDQRGVARPKDGACDVGAVELAPTSLQAALVGGRLVATVTSATGSPANLPDPRGAVTFAELYMTMPGCEQVPVDASGHMSCTPDYPPMGPLTATFESSNGFAVSRDTVSGISSIVLSPASASVGVGEGRTYTATGYDDDGNAVADLTSSATFTISPDGSCVAARCTPAKPGRHTVTASFGGITGTALLVAEASPGSGPSTSGGGGTSASSLPRTGPTSDLGLMAWLGAALIAAGAAFAAAARRRRA